MIKSAKSPSTYYVNPFVDVMWIGGGSICAYFILWALYGSEVSQTAILIAGYAQWVVNWPHFSATNYRLYRTPKNYKQYPITAFVIPFLVLAGVIASFLSTDLIAPYFIKLFMVWSPYHFSAQTLGITLLYLHRQGYRIDKLQRLGLSGFIFGTYVVTTMRAETSLVGNSYYQISYPGFGLPSWMAVVAEVWMYGSALLLGVLLVRSWVKNRTVPPLMLFIPASAQYCWFVVGDWVPSFYSFVPFFHSLQYLLIAWMIQLKERSEEQNILPSNRFVISASMRWWSINVVGGIVLFWGLPHLTASAGIDLNLAMGIIIAGVQIHHFFVDGVIWKLRNAETRSPLMTDISELRGRSSGRMAA